jgi:hypothetical protein
MLNEARLVRTLQNPDSERHEARDQVKKWGHPKRRVPLRSLCDTIGQNVVSDVPFRAELLLDARSSVIASTKI